MNTKKLIGTILGVILFAALIAGATFAWLSGDVSVVNTNTLNTAITNFVVDYTTGSMVSDLPIVDSTIAKPGTVADTNAGTLSGAETAVTAIVIKRPSDSSTIPDGHASIWLKTTSTTALTRHSVVKWAICRSDPNDSRYSGCEGIESFATEFAKGKDSKVLNMGTISATGIIPLLSDARLADSVENRGDDVVEDCTAGTVETAGGNSTETDSWHTGTEGPSMCTGTTVNNHMLTTTGVTYYVYFWLDGANIQNHHLYEQYPGTKSTQFKWAANTTLEQISQGVATPAVADDTPNTSGAPAFDLYSGYVFASATQLAE